jgi:hypothetical protein
MRIEIQSTDLFTKSGNAKSTGKPIPFASKMHGLILRASLIRFVSVLILRKMPRLISPACTFSMNAASMSTNLATCRLVAFC